MSVKNNLNEFPDLVQSLLERAIRKHALRMRKAREHVVFLENENCQLRLSGSNSHRLNCSFSSKLNEADKDFDLTLFLFVMFGKEASQIFPLPDSQWRERKRLRHDLAKCNDLLIDGRLDLPLGGDFSWAGKYAATEAEYMGLSDALSAIYDTGCEKVRGKITDMRGKWNNGDFTWILDAQETLAARGPCIVPP